MSSDDWMTASTRAAADCVPVDLRTDVPHPARVYNVLLGGKDNFSADRAAAEAGLALTAAAGITARANREFLRRVVEYLTREAGIRSFVDIGPGLPASPNVHEVAQDIAPDARVVYVDNDPIVLVHARALLTSPPGRGATDYIDADLRKPEAILAGAADLLGPDQRIGLLLVAVLHHIPNEDDPHGIVTRLVHALPAGSYLALSHATDELEPEKWQAIAEDFRRRGGVFRPRSRKEIERFFDGLELVEPGLQLVHRWRPDASDRYADQPDHMAAAYGAVARIP